MLTKEQQAMILSAFRTEGQELVQKLGEATLDLEKSTSASNTKEIAQEAFRFAHSIKGSASTLDLGRIERLTHTLEDVIGAIRDELIEISPDLVDSIFSALDLLDNMIANHQPGQTKLNPEEQTVAKQLGDCLSKTKAKPQKRSKTLKTKTKPSPKTPSEQNTKIHNEQDARDEPVPQGQHANKASSSANSGAFENNNKQNDQDDLADDETSAPSADEHSRSAESYVRISQSKLDLIMDYMSELVEMKIRMKEMFSSIRSVEETFDKLNHPETNQTRKQLQRLSLGLLQDTQYLGKLLTEVQDELNEARMVTVSTLQPLLRRTVRDVCRKRNIDINFTLSGGDYELDRKIVEEIKTPLIHILRNAAYHGIESPDIRRANNKSENGSIHIAVNHQGNTIMIEITDDGAGIDYDKVYQKAITMGLLPQEAEKPNAAELRRMLFHSGLSTAEKADSISGRGVGLDAVKQSIESLRGVIQLQSKSNEGTSFHITLPLTLASETGLFFDVGSQRYVLPRSSVERVLTAKRSDVHTAGQHSYLWYKEENIPLLQIHNNIHISGLAINEVKDEFTCLILRSAEMVAAFAVQKILGEAEIVLRDLGSFIQKIPKISGLTISAAGEMNFVLNPTDLIRSATRRQAISSSVESQTQQTDYSEKLRHSKVLVVDDSVASRTLHQQLLSSLGVQVQTAVDGAQAFEMLTRDNYQLVLTDIQMPNLDGFALTEKIRTSSALKDIPVVLLSSLESEGDKQRGAEVGANKYLIKKQLSQNTLRELLQNLL